MSNTDSTKRLLDLVSEQIDMPHSDREEIKRRLWAADKLCEAANMIIKEIASYDDDDSDEYIICQFKDLIQLRKAIAEYGGNA